MKETNKNNKKIIAVTISPEFYNLSKFHKINRSEALIVGISMMLADKGITRYDNQLNRMRKLKYLQEFEKVLENLIKIEEEENGRKIQQSS